MNVNNQIYGVKPLIYVHIELRERPFTFNEMNDKRFMKAHSVHREHSLEVVNLLRYKISGV